MQTHRILSGLTVLLMIVLVAAGYLLVAQPQLAAASAATDQLTTVNAQIANTQATISKLKTEQKKLPELKGQLAGLRQSIPNDAQVSSYINSLNDLAGSTGVSIQGLKVDSAQAYTLPVAPVVAAAPAPSASPSPSASAAPVTVTAPAAPVVWAPTTDPSITAANFVAIPVSVTTEGAWSATLAFIKGLQTGARLFLVTGIDTSVNAANPNAISASISGLIYVIIDTKGASIDVSVTGTATASPAPTATVTPNPSGSSTPTPTTSPTPTK
jgi:hypothetical protein